MEPIFKFLKEQKTKSRLSNVQISSRTGIHETNISKHMNGALSVSDTDLIQYSKCFNFNYHDIKSKYSCERIEICKDGTLAEVLKIGAGALAAAGASVLAYKGVEKLIDANCKKISK